MMLCDAHADTLFSMVWEKDAKCDLSLKRLQQGGVNLQVLALFVGLDNRREAYEPLIKSMLVQFEALQAQGWRKVEDPKEARKGETRFMLSLEGGEPFTEGLHTIAAFRDMGVRMAALTWNHENALGTPHQVDETTGLTAYGIQVVREMQRLRMAVDVSHLNIAGFYDVLNRTDQPPLASHSCCRALCDHSRNLTDQQLKDLFSAGGYVGVNFYPRFLKDGDQACTLLDIVHHIDHMHQLGGQGKVGFGSDFDGITLKPEGMKDPRDFPSLLAALKERGYQDQALRDIAGQGFLDYFERIAQ